MDVMFDFVAHNKNDDDHDAQQHPHGQVREHCLCVYPS